MQNIHITTQDNFTLTSSVFQPNKSNQKVVLINSATAVLRHYYKHFAAFLADLGYWVYTYDYRGVGDSKPTSLRKFKAYMHEWGQKDFDAMLTHIQQEHSNKKILLIGHSVGGQIVGFSPQSKHLEGIFLVASQAGYWKNWDKGRLMMWSTMKVTIPLLCSIFGYLPSKKLGIMEDLPAGVALEWSKWCRSPEYLFDYFHHQSYFYNKIDKPIKALSFSDDIYAPYKAVEQLMKHYEVAEISHSHFEPKELGVSKIGHFGFFQKKMKDKLWKKASDWLEAF